MKRQRLVEITLVLGALGFPTVGPADVVPWQPSDGLRPVAGIGLEWFHRFFRVDFGVSLRTGDVSLVVDVTRDLWNIL